MGYTPKDTATLEQITNALEWPLEMYEKGTNWLGDTTLQHTGSPVAAAGAKSLPKIIGGAFGIRSALKRAK